MDNDGRQGILSYRIKQESATQNLTSLAGLAPYLDLACASGLVGSIHRNLRVREYGQGWTDTQVVPIFGMLNLVGGDCVDDLEHLEADEGFGRLLKCYEARGLSRRVRREMKKRWRKARTRSVVSPSVARRYLSAFHDEEQEELRESGKAFIPKANSNLVALRSVNAEFVAFVQSANKEMVATLDLDAVLIETAKSSALYCYKHFAAYQPYNVYWAEQGLMLHSEFRDGNVPACYDQLRVLKEALSYLPSGVVKVRIRSDSAGYVHELLRYCEMKVNDRFGRIEFVIGCDVTPEFKGAVEDVAEDDWRPLYKEVDGKHVKTGREYAEVCFVPDAIAFTNNAPTYRYLATREALSNQPLPGLEEQLSLPFQTMTKGKVTYKVFGIVTNMDWLGDEIIRFHDGRCGKAEEAHKILKEDFAGGRMPSDGFGANAAWWAIAILAMNLSVAMNRLVLGGAWANRRMKAIRFLIICLPGRVIERARQLYLRLSRGHPAFETLVRMRLRICELATGPPLPA
jgi:hypothetical protein